MSNQPSHNEHDCYQVQAGLTNLDKRIYVQSSFILPSRAPEYPMSKYVARWDAYLESYKVTLRQSISGGGLARQTNNLDCAHDVSKNDMPGTVTSAATYESSLGSPMPKESADCIQENTGTEVPVLVPGSALQPKETQGPPAVVDETAKLADEAVSVAASDGQKPAEASPSLSLDTARCTALDSPASTLTILPEVENSDDIENRASGSPVNVHGLTAPPTSQGLPNDCEPFDADESLLDTPVKPDELSRPSAPTPARARRIQDPYDESMFESPVKASDIGRPNAPSSAHGETYHMLLNDNQDDNSSVVTECSGVDDVFGVREAVFTCEEKPSKHVLPLDCANITLIKSVDALDLHLYKDTVDTHTNIDWLHLFLKPGDEEIISDYNQLSLKSMLEFLEDAIKTVGCFTIPSPGALAITRPEHHTSTKKGTQNMETDLDAFFGGQGVTDLGEDNSIDSSVSGEFTRTSQIKINEEESLEHEVPDHVAEAISYASDLLCCKTRGLPLSQFIPKDDQADYAIQWFFKNNGLEYTRTGARLAASMAAYFYFSQGLDTLKRNGFASRQYPKAAGYLQDWFFLQPNSAGKLPYDPRPPRTTPTDENIDESEKSRTPADDHHDNFPRIMIRKPTAPRTFYMKLNPEGFFEHWDSIETSRRIKPLPRLSVTQSVDDSEFEPCTSSDDAKVADMYELSVISEEEEGETVRQPVTNDPDPAQSDTMTDTVWKAEELDSGYTSEDHDIDDLEPTSKPDEIIDADFLSRGPITPGLHVAYEDWQPVGVSQNRSRYIDEHPNRSIGNNDTALVEEIHDSGNEHSESEDSSSEEDSDEEKQRQSSRETTPPTPHTKFSLLSMSPISVNFDCPPYTADAAEPQPQEKKPADPEPIVAETTAPKPADEGLSKYAPTYATILVSIGVILSFW